MRLRRPTRALALVALLALAGLGAALYEESFVHTDDGCTVEVHCLACRLLLSGATVLATVPTIAPAAVAVSTAVASDPLVARMLRPASFKLALHPSPRKR